MSSRRHRRRLMPWSVVVAAAVMMVAGCGSSPSSPVDGGLADGWTTDASGRDGQVDGLRDGTVSPTDGGVETDLDRLRALMTALPGAASDDERWLLVNDFIGTVAYGERGFPIREEGQLGVLLIDSTGGALTLAGDFNAWDAVSLPLTQPLAGFPVYTLITPVTEPLPRTLYKLVRNGTDWFADPLARRYGWDDFGEHSLAEAGDAVSHLERWPHFGEGAGLLAPRDVVVYVPAGYEATSTLLPALYLHDGQNLFSPDAPWGGWQAAAAADQRIGSGSCQPLLMVGIDNTADRMDEYTHVTDDIGTGSPVGGRADEYVDFVVGGVRPFIESRYRARTDAAGRGLLGSSLGGLVSLYAVTRHPTVFAHAGSMSGTVWWGEGLGNPTVGELFTATPPVGISFYLDSGGSGICPGSNDNYCANVALAGTLRGLGYVDEVDLIYRWVAGATHDEAAWADRFPALLTDWFPGP